MGYGLAPSRLPASQSLLRDLACAPIRRGLPFAPAKGSKTGQRGTELSPLQTPLTLGCAGYECCFSALAEKQIRTARRCAPKVACGGSSGATCASIGQTLRYTMGSPLRCGAPSSPHKVLRPCGDSKSPRAGARRANHLPSLALVAPKSHCFACSLALLLSLPKELSLFPPPAALQFLAPQRRGTTGKVGKYLRDCCPKCP